VSKPAARYAPLVADRSERPATPETGVQPKQRVGEDIGPPRLVPSGDLDFLRALKAARLLGELSVERPPRICYEEARPGVLARRQSILRTYFSADGDEEASLRRRLQDRYFALAADDPASAAELVTRLATITPELPDLRLAQLHETTHRTSYALKSGGSISRIADEWARLSVGRDGPAITHALPVRSIVRALNELLDGAGTPQRLAPLLTDRTIDVYVGIGHESAAMLSEGGYLEDIDIEDVIELCRFA
jgi:hypothetical protein